MFDVQSCPAGSLLPSKGKSRKAKKKDPTTGLQPSLLNLIATRVVGILHESNRYVEGNSTRNPHTSISPEGSMKKQEIGSIAFKIAGVYVLVKGVLRVDGLIAVLIHLFGDSPVQYGGGLLFAVLGPTAFLVALGVLLIYKSNRLAAGVFGVAPEEIMVSGTTRELQAAAFAVLGVGLVVFAVCGMLHQMGTLVYLGEVQSTRSFGATLGRMKVTAWVGIFVKTVEIIIGFALFFGARRFANWWHHLRGFGHAAPAEQKKG